VAIPDCSARRTRYGRTPPRIVLRSLATLWDADDETPLHERTGFAALLAQVLGSGAKVVLVESLERVGHDPVVQFTAHTMCDDSRERRCLLHLRSVQPL
jgi:hypothetical protein